MKLKTYSTCKCGLPVHNKKKDKCVPCLRDEDFARQARQIGRLDLEPLNYASYMTPGKRVGGLSASE